MYYSHSHKDFLCSVYLILSDIIHCTFRYILLCCIRLFTIKLQWISSISKICSIKLYTKIIKLWFKRKNYQKVNVKSTICIFDSYDENLSDFIKFWKNSIEENSRRMIFIRCLLKVYLYEYSQLLCYSQMFRKRLCSQRVSCYKLFPDL